MDSPMTRYIGRGLEGSHVQELLSLWSWVNHPPVMWMCSPTQKLPKPHATGIFMEVSSYRITDCPSNLLPNFRGGMVLKMPSF